MTVFLIVSDDDNSDLAGRIAEEFPKDDHYVLSNNLWLVDASKTTGEVAKSLDVIDGKFGKVVVFSVSGHSGYHKQSLWEWMQLD